jgi:DUF2075 family protein
MVLMTCGHQGYYIYFRVAETGRLLQRPKEEALLGIFSMLM